MFAKVSAVSVGLLVLLMATWAWAIVIDGVNDFPPSSLIDPDGGDTEFAPIDLGNVYVTYDATALYIGYQHDHDGWGGIQIGIAIVVDHDGGSPDPWGHQIVFAGTCKPHYVAYVNLDSNWNEWCVWNHTTSTWDRTGNGLNWVVTTPFDEIMIPFSMIGIDCREYNSLGVELWVTQDSPTKGPLDLSLNDNLQLSTPGGTIWDIQTPVIIACYHCIVIGAPSGTESTTWGNIKALYQ
ncbi:MAG: hypothetical protein V1694_11000 [Candidatus Eisenbacteria bacterium]